MNEIAQRPGDDQPAGSEGIRHRAERPAAEDRGTLQVHPNVVRKIAQRTADTTPGTITVGRKITSIGAGHRGTAAKVSDRGGVMDVALDVALHYPASVSDLSAQLRTRVTDEVQRLTGCRVRRVAVTVSALLPDVRRRVE